MITIQQASDRIRDLSEQEVQELTRDRLLGDDVAPVGSSYADEPPEDLVIQLLRNPELPKATRYAVIEGCKEVYVQLQDALLRPGRGTARDWQTVAVHLCGTVDVASPPELKGLVYALLDLILYSPKVSPAFLPPAVRAAMGYDQTEDRIPAWEKIMNDHPPVAAYAFNALLTIIPQSPRIEQYLKTLWEKQTMEDWPVDTAFLMRRALRKQGHDMILHILRWLRRQPCATQADSELERREWSRDWLKQRPVDSSEERYVRSSPKPDALKEPDLVKSEVQAKPLPPIMHDSPAKNPKVIKSTVEGSFESCMVIYNAKRDPRVAAVENLEDEVKMYCPTAAPSRP